MATRNCRLHKLVNAGSGRGPVGSGSSGLFVESFVSRSINCLVGFVLLSHLFNYLKRLFAWLSTLGLSHHLFSFNHSSSLSLQLFLLLLLELDQVIVEKTKVPVLLGTFFGGLDCRLESVVCIIPALFHFFLLLHLHLCLLSSLFISQESFHAAVCSATGGAHLLIGL